MHLIFCSLLALLALVTHAQNDSRVYVEPPPGIFTTDASFAADTNELVEDTSEDVYTLQELATAKPGFQNRLKPYAHPSSEYHMRPVRVIHARAVADMPVYDSIYSRFISGLGSRIDVNTSVKGFTAAMDTVTTASMEGIVMFLHTEVVNQFGRTVTTRCHRKNDIQFIVFYELLIAQPNTSIAMYKDDNTTIPEYGPFVSMDHGRCSPLTSTLGEDKFPEACYQFNGNQGSARVGPFVGATSKDQEMRGVYKDAYWFSFPNSCPLQPWSAKTHTCRLQTMRGLCPPGKLPDGVACTYTYNILGFLPLDDLVGITSMVNIATGSPYANFSEFCGAGNVEFAAYDRFGYVFKTLPFWEFPLDPEANARRTQQMIAAYQKLASPDGSSSQIYFRLREKMQPLPMIDELTAQNPPCYETVRECGSTAEFGCKRETYAQICRLCTTEAKGCVKAPPTFGFPVLERPKSTASSERSGEEKASPMLQSGVGRVLPHTLILLVFWCQFIY